METKKPLKKVRFEDLKLKNIASLQTASSMITQDANQSSCSMTNFPSVVSDADSVGTNVYEPLLP